MLSTRARFGSRPVFSNGAEVAGTALDRHRALIAAGAGALVLAGSLLSFLNHNDYPLLTSEVGLAIAGSIGVAGAVGLLYGATGRIGRTVLDLLLVFVALDLNFDGIGVLLASVTATLVFNRLLSPIPGIVFLVVLVTEALRPAWGSGDIGRPGNEAIAIARSDAPVLLHLILDEHIGIDGLPSGMPEAAATRRDLVSFYADNGFRLFGGAYSEHFHTINVIPYILNFGAAQPWEPAYKEGRTMAANAYFDRLAGLGYAIKVYQTDFLDYCSSPKVESCTSYRSADLGPVATTPLPATQKTALMLYGLLSLSETVSFAGTLYDLAAWRLMQDGMEPPLLDLSARRRTSTIGALAAFDRLIADLRRARPGEVYFAHLLLPHYPYVTDRSCAVKGIAEWQMRRSPRQAWRDRQLAYFEQLRCATSKLQAALDALAASPAGGRSIVVVHGDHGSRITRRDPIVANLARLDDQDLIGSYSTLFAVRAKGIAPGYEATRLPVARLLSALARSSFRSVDPGTGPDFEPSVVLEDEHWQPLGRHDLPASWASPETENAPGSVSDRPAPEQGPLAPTLR